MTLTDLVPTGVNGFLRDISDPRSDQALTTSPSPQPRKYELLPDASKSQYQRELVYSPEILALAKPTWSEEQGLTFAAQCRDIVHLIGWKDYVQSDYRGGRGQMIFLGCQNIGDTTPDLPHLLDASLPPYNNVRLSGSWLPRHQHF